MGFSVDRPLIQRIFRTPVGGMEENNPELLFEDIKMQMTEREKSGAADSEIRQMLS